MADPFMVLFGAWIHGGPSNHISHGITPAPAEGAIFQGDEE